MCEREVGEGIDSNPKRLTYRANDGMAIEVASGEGKRFEFQ